MNRLRAFVPVIGMVLSIVALWFVFSANLSRRKNPTPSGSVGTGIAVATRPGRAPSGCHVRGSGLYVLPDPRCSPGATNPLVTQGNLDRTICQSGYSKSIRPPESVTSKEKLVDMKAYGFHGSPHPYELDHIISLELGGATNSYRNYYPERDYPGSHLGFYLNPKDKLEGALHRLVCDAKMSLRTAQHDIATNWVVAYHRYG